MLEVTGELWTYPADLRCITTNGMTNKWGDAVMGAGNALEARQRYSQIDKHLGALLRLKGNHVHLLRHDLASFPTKWHWKNPSDPLLIERSAWELMALVTHLGYQQVVLPRPGCGLGLLKWEQVRPILEPLFDNRFTIITHALVSSAV